ncbi:MAG: hypothetical protein K9N46_10895 [Candidatus Marinimicrobia bacterium]|nr:hypothetical protein [Candidatus Neomarinimicrobiota bacterium]MCF7827712.1 hypothetical protein [Candidatus Neomarinimicrobiota bacterium]MCF7881233.1 hypothetical protein [Candidatus Neomarinimicrobiota bacterium]
MIRINLLEKDRLGQDPLESDLPEDAGVPKEEPTGVPPEEAETQAAEPEEELQETEPAEDSEPKVHLPRGKKRQPGQPPRKRPPKDAALSRGPSTGFIVFLLLIAIGVTAYFSFFHKSDMPEPVPVSTDTTVQEITQDTVTTQPAAEASQQVPPETKQIPERAESPGYFQKFSDQELRYAVAHGKKKLESAYRLLSSIQNQSDLGFLSIGNEHLTLSAITESPSFANRIRRQVTNTSIIRNIELFQVTGLTSDNFTEVSVYANLTALERQAESTDLRQVDIGDVHHQLKEWISIPTIELTEWNAKQVNNVNGWNRGPLYIQMAGTKTGIIRVIHSLKNYGYNFGVSKIYVYAPRGNANTSDQYIFKLFITLFGAENL